MLGALFSLHALYWKNFCTQGGYCTISNGVFNFNFLALVVSEIVGGPKFTFRGSVPLEAP